MTTISVFYLAPLCVEFLPSGLGLIPVFAAISSVLVGDLLVYRAKAGPGWKGLFLLLGANIQSVFIYNLFAGMQHMNFFRPGWTA